MIQGTIDFKKINKKTLGIKDPTPTVRRLDEDTDRENLELLWKCRSYYDSLATQRKERSRARDYHRGRQWDDLIRHPKTGRMIRESELIKEQGRIPFVQNQVRQLVKNLDGQYRRSRSESIVLSRDKDEQEATEMMTNAMHYAHQINNAKERYASAFTEFLLSGMPMLKVTFGPYRTRDTYDLIIENKSLSRMFLNTDISDIQHRDLRIIGEIHDIPLDTLVSRFARTREDEAKIRQWYSQVRDEGYFSRVYGFSPDSVDNLDFFIPTDYTKCRVIEVWEYKGEWRLEIIDRSDLINPITISNRPRSYFEQENARRLADGAAQDVDPKDIILLEINDFYEQFWYYKYLTPNGYCLQEGETPYEHQEHPYVFLTYPLIDGEVWGFVSDIIDIQRQLNRYIILMDMAINSAAKGVLLVPADVVPDGMSPDDFSAQWTSINGVIYYTPKAHGKIPEQVSNKSTNFGAQEMIAIYSKLLTDISGVQGAIQGQNPGSGTPYKRYAMEAENASINNIGYMETFATFVKDVDYKIIQTIKQYYTQRRYLAISGRAFKEAAKLYDPELVKDMAFDTVISEGSNTPVFRMAMEDTLQGLLDKGLISLKMFLKHTNLPFADAMLEDLDKEQSEGLPPQVMQAAQQGDPKALAMIQQYMKPAA